MSMFANTGKFRFLTVSAAAVMLLGAVGAAEARRGKGSWGSSASKAQSGQARSGATVIVVPRPSGAQNTQNPPAAAPNATQAPHAARAAVLPVATGGDDEQSRPQPLGAPLPVLGSVNQMAETSKRGFSPLN
ncbi:MAG: hypothetical protein CTY25_14450 [Methylobacterium sp.]|nr:MAG: hypothetical protein CTY25_14450 [Methylobacterium sp.]